MLTEDEELPHRRAAEHFVAVGPLDHTAQQGCDPFVFGDEYLFDQIFDLVAHSRPVFGSEARFGSYAGQRVLFACFDQFDFPQAVFFLFVRIGVRRRTEQHHAVEPFGVFLAESQGDVTAHRMSHQGTAGDTERIERILHHIGQVFHRVYRPFDHRDPVPRQVERNHAYLFVKIGDEIVPDEHRLQITVQQDRAPVSFFGVAHMDGRVACRNEFFNHCRVDFQFSSSSK